MNRDASPTVRSAPRPAAVREWLSRWDAPMPFQTWRPFPEDAIVCVEGPDGERNTGPVTKFWWGYEQDMGRISDGVIVRARRLDRPLEDRTEQGEATQHTGET